MGTTGLETAFAALLHRAGAARRARARDRDRADDRRRRAVRAADPADRARPARPTCAWSTSRRASRSVPTATPAARPTAASTGALLQGKVLLTVAAGTVAFTGPGCRPRPRRFGDGQPTAYVLLEDGDPLRRARLRRRRARGRRDRVHDLDVRLPGGDDRPELRRAAAHVHLPADRQLRRVEPRRWSQTACTPAPRSCARRSTATTLCEPSRAGSPGSTANGIPAITDLDTRALVRHIRDRGAMRGGVFPAAIAEADARELIDAGARHGRPRPRARRDADSAHRPRQRERGRGWNSHRDDRHRRQALDRPQPARARRDRRASSLHGHPGSSCRAIPTRSSWPTVLATRPRSTTSSTP